MNEQLCVIESLLEELSLLKDHVIIVEGINDRKALNALGIDSEIVTVQSEGPLKISERVHMSGKNAVILTDWDRKGDEIAEELRRNLSSLDVRTDTSIRSRIRDVCVKDIKDVESLPALYERLSFEK